MDSAVPVTVAMLATATLVGAINGVVYVFGRLPHPFIITLATLSICRGLALELAIGHTTMRGMPDWIVGLGGSETFGVPNSFFVVLAVAARGAAHDQGDGLGPVDLRGRRQRRKRRSRWAFPSRACWSRLTSSPDFASALERSFSPAEPGPALPSIGNLLELDTIAAVIIGGASFLGGRGHIGHALIGAVMIGVIRNALNLLNVDVFFQMIAIGLIIVVAVEADVLRSHLEGAGAVHSGRERAMNPAAAAPGFRSPTRAKALRRGAGAQGREL